VEAVILDRTCGAEAIAETAGVPVEIVERESYGPAFDRDAYTHRVIDALKRHQIDVIAMAGFGTILAADIFSVFPGRILNTHPALLPAFKGWHAVRDALAAGVKVTGCTVHVATEMVDEGPILAQEAVVVEAGDTEATLHERIKSVERRLYPETIRLFLQNQEGATR
jgi:phosphoribosylglycinamide formyltransferase-1